MGFATHLGPWLLGTVKNTSGTTAGTVQNTGCTIVAQTFNLTAAQVATGSIAAGFTPTQANVGATDAALTFTTTGSSSTGAATVIVAYIVRNTDGAMQQAAQQN